ncbi:hypothetical protein HDV01_003271 [Terramyces sp. JEL0728]|nr:hypothetical protein HDV01_003271 [Terramyces sp. JEL0728]
MEEPLDPNTTNSLTTGVAFNSEETIHEEPRTDQLPPLSPNSIKPSFKSLPTNRMSMLSTLSEQPSFISSASSDAILEIIPEPTKSGQSKRRRIMNEILDTEIRYVSDLQFLKTKKSYQKSRKVINARSIMDIFGHHESILAVNRELSNQLQKRIELWNRGNDLIGDIFIPFLRVYSIFLTKFNDSINLVADLTTKNAKFAAFARSKAAHPDSHGLVLQAFLVLPVQRIPRYKLLLEDLFKHTPEDHPDYENIKKAIESVSQVATFVNETIRNHEAMLQMVDIQKSLIGFKDDHYHFHRMIPLEFCRVEDVCEDGQFIFQIVSREKSFAVYVQFESEKIQWIESIRKAITEWHVENDAIHDRLPSNSPVADFDAPIWMPDESAQSCLVCFDKFTFFNRKHHCRSCGILVCGGCSQNSFYIPSRNGEKKARVCDTCLPSLIQERKFSINAPRSTTPEDLSEADRASLYSTSPVNISERRSSMLPSGSSVVSTLLVSRPKRIAKSLTAQSLYSSIVGSPKSHTDCCSLCKEKFNFFHKEIHCKSCDRIVCAGCASKESSKNICDPCVLGVSPVQIFVNPKGGEWCYRPN